jgi:hypothetical protein
MFPDEEAKKEGYIRVIDESGEDLFIPSPISLLSNYRAKSKKRYNYQNNLRQLTAKHKYS